ncbi:protein translocase subunit SecE [Planctomycetales bacterium]|nr:protein translocase subunit SecE [Planctomycetales bacterium]
MDLVKELFRVQRYKVSQGRLVRRLTMIGVWILFIVGAYKCSLMAFGGIPILSLPNVPYALSAIIALFGLWFGFRLVNWSRFADFMITVEAEMVKVSWPGNAELYSSTIVVLVIFALLSVMIYIFDLVWVFIFRITGVV